MCGGGGEVYDLRQKVVELLEPRLAKASDGAGENPDDPRSFALSSVRGDRLWLSAADPAGNLTGDRVSVQFGPAENAAPFGRYQTSVGIEFVSLSARTFGQDDPANTNQWRQGTGKTNAPPLVGPIVINEIMYHPPDLDGTDNTLHEFVDLKNISGSDVRFYDQSFPTNAWRREEARWISLNHNWREYCAIQQRHTYLRPKPGASFFPQLAANEDLFDYCRNRKITLLAYSALLRRGIQPPRAKIG